MKNELQESIEKLDRLRHLVEELRDDAKVVKKKTAATASSLAIQVKKTLESLISEIESGYENLDDEDEFEEPYQDECATCR